MGAWIRLPIVAVAIAWMLLTGHGSAQDSQLEAARAMARAGHELYRTGDYEGAIERFEAAEAIVHAPPHLLFIARSKVELGRLVSGRGIYRRLLDEELGDDAPGPFAKAQREGEVELAALEARIPKLAIRIEGAAEARVTVDGEVADVRQPVWVDPGEHEVAAETDGYQRAARRVTVRAGDEPLAVRLEMMPSPELQPAAEAERDDGSSMSIPALTLLGAGAAGLVVGAITGLLAASKVSELRDRCPDNPCAPENAPLKEEATTLATVSTIGFVAGGLLAAGGGTWLVIDVMASDEEVAAFAGIGGAF
jgi:hypothetical protein